MKRSILGALLAMALIPACESDSDLTSTGVPTYCQINWSGALETDASVFDLRACWDGRCTNDIALLSAPSDAGTPPVQIDAGCTPAPTTPGGLPSGCRAARTQGPPITPSSGCGSDDIGDQFSVRACASTGSNGQTRFEVTLTPARPSYPAFGGTARLTIETPTGLSLLATEARVPSAEGTNAACRGASFTLDGTLLSP